MSINWDTPLKRNGIITQYKIEINGKASYKDETGRMKTERLRSFIDYVDIQYNLFTTARKPSPIAQCLRPYQNEKT